MKRKADFLLFCFVLLGTSVTAAHSRTDDRALNEFLHPCTHKLVTRSRPESPFSTIETIEKDLTASKLAQALHGYQFTGKSGRSYSLGAQLDRYDEQILNITVYNESQIPVFTALQTVQNRVLTLSNIMTTLNATRASIEEQFSKIMRSQLQNMSELDFGRLTVNSKWDFNTDIKLTQITFTLSNGLERAILKFVWSESEASWLPSELYSIDSHHPDIRKQLAFFLQPERLGSLIRTTLQYPRIEFLIRALKQISDAENDGIATALHRAYLDAVPAGTRKVIRVANQETLDLIMKQRDYRKKEVLKRVYPETKLGHIFIKSGWKLEDISFTDEEGLMIDLIKPKDKK